MIVLLKGYSKRGSSMGIPTTEFRGIYPLFYNQELTSVDVLIRSESMNMNWWCSNSSLVLLKEKV